MTIKAILDTRRALDSGKFPVKIRLTAWDGRWVQRYYPTGVSLSQAQWESVKNDPRSQELRGKRSIIFGREALAQKIYTDNPQITLTAFDAIFSGRVTQSTNLDSLFEEVIEGMKDRVSSARLYKNALDSIKGAGADSLNHITVDWLKGYEASMKSTHSISTVGIYLRNLRAVYNIAIDRKIISHDLYPFGRKGYIIPTSSALKRALDENQKSRFVAYKAKGLEKEALDHWRFSYYTNGMNFTDMAYLTNDNIQGDVLVYTRRKTTRERNSTPHIVPMRKEVTDILKGRNGKTLFEIIDLKDSPEEQKDKINAWILNTNKYLKRIAKRLKMPPVTTYTARHTMATMMLRTGAGLLDVRDALGHSSVQTTEKYLKSLDLSEKRKQNARL